MKALLAVDGSAHALRAARTLVDLSKHCARTSAHVLNVQPHIAYVDLLGADRKASIDRWVQARGREVVEDACGVLTVGGVPFEIEVVSADTALAIARIAVDRRCDFILMGTRGMGAAAGMALGSVATKVAHLADLPVTLVK
jgi:nucleotide-binding universal stress UspA family protein